MTTKPIGILYEHPEWFVPLFAEMDRRGLPYERIQANAYGFDPSAPTTPIGWSSTASARHRICEIT